MSHVFFPTDYRTEDVPATKTCDEYFRINVFGKTDGGNTILVRCRFTPAFLMEVPESWSQSRTNLFVTETALKYEAIRDMCVTVKRKNMWGYDGGRVRNMVQFVFKTTEKMRRAKFQLKRSYQLYESSVDPLVRIFHIQKLDPAGWMKVTNAHAVREKISRSDIEVETTFRSLSPHESNDVPPLIIASWDIETYSKERRFPLAKNPTDYVTQIATSFQRYGEPEPYKVSVVCLRDTAPVDGVEITSCLNEQDVINAWINIMHTEKTDVLIGYNTFQYDWAYIKGRSQVLVDDMSGDDTVALEKLGRLLDGGGNVIERDLSSNAFGQNSFLLLDVPGVMQIDLLQWFRKNRSLESYSLNNVSKEYLGDQKNDLPAMQIFERFEGDADDRAVIASYAAKDTLLPLHLLRKLAIFEDLTEMSNAVKVPVDYINFRGQQVSSRYLHPCVFIWVSISKSLTTMYLFAD
jgi:DNA polymerase delta subunit 1